MAGLLFDFMAKLSLDKSNFDKGIDESSNKAHSFGEKFKAVGKAIETAAKVTWTGASVAVGYITKSAVGAYSEYEQLVGGVQTLFGTGGQSLEEYAKSVGKSVDDAREEFETLKSAENDVLNNSKQAFKTAGLSANEYMETVTGFSASLIQSLGGDTEKAAKYADMAIIDMSDNANKMGTSMEAIQNAYSGFSKQNYTMLDNLKLGYGGTKSEMERLIADAEKLDSSFKASRDTNGKLTMSYADVVDAIHIVQTNMGIAGTTVKEAQTTIEGSLKSTKAAWSNLMVALAGGEINVGDAINNLVESAQNLFGNVVPVVKQLAPKVAEAIKTLSPIIAKELPGLISSVLPDLLSAISVLVVEIAKQLPGILSALWDTLTVVLDELWKQLFGGDASFKKSFNSAIDWIRKAIGDIVSWIKNTIDSIIKWYNTYIKPVIDTIAKFFQKNVTPVVNKAFDGMKTGVQNAFNGIVKLWNNTLKPVFENLKKFISNNLAPAFKNVFQGTIMPIFRNTFNAIKEIWNKSVKPIFEGIIKFWSGVFSGDTKKAWEGVRQIVNGAWTGIKTLVKTAGENLKIVLNSIWGAIGGKVTSVWETIKNSIVSKFRAARDAVVLVVASIRDKIVAVFNSIKSFAATVWNKIKTTITTPINAARTIVVEKINAIKTSAVSIFNSLRTYVSTIFTAIKTNATTIWNNVKNAIITPINNVRTTVTSKIRDIRTTITSVFASVKTSVTTIWNNIKNAIITPITAAKNKIGEIIESIKNLFNFEFTWPKIPLPHFKASGSPNPIDWITGAGSPPHISVEWYRKAYQNAMMFTSPTVLPTLGGYKGFGDGVGAEIVLSEQKLREIAGGGDTFNFNIYAQPGQDEEAIARAVQRQFVRWNNQQKAVFG